MALASVYGSLAPGGTLAFILGGLSCRATPFDFACYITTLIQCLQGAENHLIDALQEMWYTSSFSCVLIRRHKITFIGM